MVKVRGPLFSVTARGTLAKAISYRRQPFGAQVEKKPDHRDARSAAQLAHRVKFQQAIAYWKGLSVEEKAAYNATADPMRMTGYQYVLKLCMTGVITPAPPEGGFAGGLLELTGVWLSG